MRASRGLTASVVIGALLLLVVGCSGDDAATNRSESPATTVAPGRSAAAAALKLGARVIDVRTPKEFAEGHIEGAWLLDVKDPSFGDAIGQLDAKLTYVVYCRSGNRSATAASLMRDAGLTVLDGGGMDDMVAAGWSAAAPMPPVTG